MCAFKDDADKQAHATFEGNPPQVAIDQNKTHGLNHTNLHTHGLWVSPTGNSDNVLNVIAPETSFQHEYLIPKDHVPGTHWYHPHKHGSVWEQVRTGMSGALIMTGGIDAVPLVARARESLMVVQKFQPSTVVPELAGSFTPETDRFRFPEDDVTTINGVRGPTLKRVAPGQTLRWRVVAAMSGDLLNLSVAPLEAGEWGGLVALHPIAYDGVPVGQVNEWKEVRLFPGNRVDIMLRFDRPGNYAIRTRTHDNDAPEIIGYVRVDQPEVRPAMEIPAGFPAEYRHPSLLDDPAVKADHTHVLFSQLSSPFRVFIDNKQFDPNRVDHRIPLGAKQEWLLLNDTPGKPNFHPFHIHVNPFQIADSSDPIYRRMKGEWLDTVGILGAEGGAGGGPGIPGWVKIRHHFKQFIGLYVLHCHILGHEDAGMMQIVEVYGSDPGTRE
jgi:FtsP/CotA-like multicopper oxidase with cupredoxin domain